MLHDVVHWLLIALVGWTDVPKEPSKSTDHWSELKDPSAGKREGMKEGAKAARKASGETPSTGAFVFEGCKRPTVWMKPVRRCSQDGGRKFCDGPRRVPMPQGEESLRAAELGLGTRQVAAQLFKQAPS